MNIDAIVCGEIDDLLQVEDGLSDWEVKFVEDMGRLMAMDCPLTEGQISKTHEVWEKHCE